MALDEAKEITSAIEKRFGRADPPDLADRSHRAELTQQMELKRSLDRIKTLGLRM
jgi:hypothetical protein